MGVLLAGVIGGASAALVVLGVLALGSWMFARLGK